MSHKPQPPLPADDDEARFDDEGSAIGHPEPDDTKESKRQTKTGAEIPVPKRGEPYKSLGKRSEPDN